MVGREGVGEARRIPKQGGPQQRKESHEIIVQHFYIHDWLILSVRDKRFLHRSTKENRFLRQNETVEFVSPLKSCDLQCVFRLKSNFTQQTCFFSRDFELCGFGARL